MTTELAPLPLPDGITAQFVETDSGLTQHVLSAGEPDRPMLLLLHGFPELAYSWRRVMRPLAELGFWVVAPDQRGYGRTTGWVGGYDDDLSAFSLPNFVRDAVALVRALGREQVHAVIGHDYGSPVAAWAALLRGDVFPRVACMSAPFGGPPAIAQRVDPVHEDMLALSPPRKHYQWYYATRAAAPDMETAPEGMEAFLRAYFHMKSADWANNQPYRLDGWTAEELAKMPLYYVMEADQTMPQAVRGALPDDAAIGACQWMTQADMDVYAAEYGRTGFQGALNSYRCGTSPRFRRDLSVFHGRRIEVPALFIAGRQDWGWAQVPGALEAMETRATADWHGTHLVDGAGHWVQQEQPDAVVEILRHFLSMG
ncbi:MAG: alpha/beta hydrolase [Pseudomonadota bacterium]